MTRVDVVYGLPLDVEKIGRGDLTLAIALYDSGYKPRVSPESNGCAERHTI